MRGAGAVHGLGGGEAVRVVLDTQLTIEGAQEVGLNLAAVLIILFTGLGGMGRGDARRSNILMRWRVGLQFVAVLIIVVGTAFLQWYR